MNISLLLFYAFVKVFCVCSKILYFIYYLFDYNILVLRTTKFYLLNKPMQLLQDYGYVL